MPGYAPLEGTVGIQPLNDIFTPDTTQRWTLGEFATGIDPYFGFGEFVYGKAATAMAPGRLVFSSEVFLMTDLPNTALMGRPFAVARANFPINTFGWFQIGGLCPIQTAASVATGVAVGIGAAGQAGTNSASKQLLNTYVAQPSTFTLTKNGSTVNGSTILGLSNIDGLFVGLAVSGTGIPGGTTIASTDPSGRFITLSAAATVTGNATMTFTYTGFLLANIQRPFSQGAIT
jgi:hypothetical protein